MSKLSKESGALYEACMREVDVADGDDQESIRFSQTDLEKHVKCSTTELLILVNELTDHLLFRPFKSVTGSVWGIRTKEVAASLAPLSEDERIVFGHIEDATSAGVWVKKIKSATAMAPNEVQKAVGKLEKMGLVKGIKSVRYPTQRTYMLSHLAPSDEVTGGSFFDAGELDLSLVEELYRMIIFHVRTRSWIDSKRRVRRRSSVVELAEHDGDNKKRRRAIESIEKESAAAKGRSDVAIIEDDSEDNRAAKRRKQEKQTNGHKPATPDIEDAVLTSKQRRRRMSDVQTLQLAHPAGSFDYPNTRTIHGYIKSTGVIRDSNEGGKLTVEEVQGLIDVLVWDAKLEPVGDGYRTVRGIEPEPAGGFDVELDEIPSNGLTEVPCGRCQLFDLCQEGTKVSAASCVYYQDWIKV